MNSDRDLPPIVPETGDMLCRFCTQPIPANARVCPNCKSDLGSFGRIVKLVPILSLLVAILAMAPNLINALSRALSTPKARVEIVDALAVDTVITLEIINLGNLTAVVERNIACKFNGDLERQTPLLEFYGARNVVVKPDEALSVTFDEARLRFPKSDQPESIHLLTSGTSLMELRSQINGAVEAQFGDMVALPDMIRFSCALPVAGDDLVSGGPSFTIEITDGSYTISHGFRL